MSSHSSRKKHVIAIVRQIEGDLAQTFCGRFAGAEDDSLAAVAWKIERGLFRADLHCALCLRAAELNELIYLRSEPAEACQ